MDTDQLAAPVIRHWYAVGWVEWVGVAGVLATLGGLYFTWFQARLAKHAAQKATSVAQEIQNAIRTSQVQIAANQLLILVPQLNWISWELNDAVSRDDESLTRRHLDSWRRSASQVHGLLRVMQKSAG